jgi:hypothetical protein
MRRRGIAALLRRCNVRRATESRGASCPLPRLSLSLSLSLCLCLSRAFSPQSQRRLPGPKSQVPAAACPLPALLRRPHHGL